jgi:hypothetical protein
MEPIKMFLIHLLWHGWKSGLWEAEYRELIKMFSSEFVVTWLKFSFGKLNLWEVPIEMFLSIFVVTWLKFGFWKLNLWKFPSRRFWVICCDMLKFGVWEPHFLKTNEDVFEEFVLTIWNLVFGKLNFTELIKMLWC